MAELILTQAETDALSWLDLDDDALGKVTRVAMLEITEVADENDRLQAYAAALLLVGEAVALNADKFDIGLNGVSREGQRVGNWTVKVRRKLQRRAAGKPSQPDTSGEDQPS